MKKPKNIPTNYKSKGTPIYRDTTALPFLDGGPLVDKTDRGELLPSVYASALGNYYAQGGMIKRADGSYSPRGLWDNIRNNAGSGKQPTKEMLAQEKKINREYKNGGQFPTPYSLPEDSFMQGGDNLHNSVYASSSAPYPGIYANGGVLGGPGDPIKKGMSLDEAYNKYNKLKKEYTKSDAYPFTDEQQNELFELEKNLNSRLGDPYKDNKSKREWIGWKGRGYDVGHLFLDYTPFYENNKTPSLPTKKLPQVETPDIIPSNYNYTPQKPEIIRTASRSQTVMEPDPNRPGNYKVKELRQIPYSAKFPGEGWEPANAPRVIYTDAAGKESETRPQLNTLDLKGQTFANGGSILSMSNTPQLEGEGKDLTYSKNAYIYASGGLINNHTNKVAMNFKLNAMGGKMYAAGGSFNNPGFKALPPDVQNKIRTNSFQYGGTMNQLNKFDKGGPLSEKANMIYNSPFTGNYPSPYVGLVPLEGQEDVYLSGDINARAYNQAMEDRGVSDEERLKYQHEELQKLMQFQNSQEFALGGPITSPKKLFSSYVPTTKFNEGGTMDQLTQFNNGGTHEENPLGGIPQGMSPDGRLNLVEEGETKQKLTDEGTGNYIYSDSIKIDKEFAEMYNLPKTYVGKTYADASKLANREKSRRENDTIEQVDIKRKLDSLAEAQEAQKQKAEQKQLAEELAANPELMEQLMAQIAMNNQSVQPMGMPQGEEVASDQVPQEMLAQMPEAQQGMPIMRMGGHMYRCGGKMYDFGGFLEDNSNTLSGVGTGAMTGAATGAKIGSIIPGIGTAIGGAVGAVAGGIAGGVKGNKKDKELEAEENMQNQALAQQNAMALNMQDPAYVSPAMQASLQSGMGASYTMPYAYARLGGNLYNQGGNLGDPPAGSTTPPSPTSSPGSPYISTYVPTLPSDYAKDYKRRAQEFKNNPINPKTDAPTWGSGTEDALSTETGGDYIPITAAERAARIKELETFRSGAVDPGYLEEYLTLKTNKPYFKATFDSNKFMSEPYDLSTYKPTVPTTTAASATALTPGTPPVGYMRSANTGELMPSRENFDEAGNVFQVDRQYSGYPEEFANAPEQIAKRKNIAQQQITNPALLKLMTGEQKEEARQLKQTALEYFEKKGLPLPTQETEISFRDGGNLIQSFNPTLMPAQENTRMLRQGDFLSGGPYNNLDYLISLATTDKTRKNKKKNKDATIKNGSLVNSQAEEDLLDEDYTAEDNALDELNLEDLKEKLNSGELSKEEYDAALGEYQSILQRIKPKLDQQDMDFSIKAHPAEVAAMALPAAYNIGMGLFGRPQQFDAEDYTVDSNITPYQYNVNPELRNIQYGFAGAQDAMRNAGLSGGAYATNVQNLNNLRNQQISELLTKKQNIDAEKYMQAQMANTQLGAQNAATRLKIQDINAIAQAAKQGLLATGLKQVGNIGEAFLNTKLQKGLVKAVAPDFAGTLNLGISPWKNTKETEEKSV